MNGVLIGICTCCMSLDLFGSVNWLHNMDILLFLRALLNGILKKLIRIKWVQ